MGRDSTHFQASHGSLYLFVISAWSPSAFERRPPHVYSTSSAIWQLKDFSRATCSSSSFPSIDP